MAVCEHYDDSKEQAFTLADIAIGPDGKLDEFPLRVAFPVDHFCRKTRNSVDVLGGKLADALCKNGGNECPYKNR